MRDASQPPSPAGPARAVRSGPRKPEWMKRKLPSGVGQRPLTGMLRDLKLVTVCEEARCPNLSECFAHGTATFMILGDICTRNCGFCSVATGKPLPPAPDEPQRVAEAVARMRLRHAVITSVDRDDLPDGGAAHWAATVRAVRERNPAVTIEILTGDFRGDPAAIDVAADARPDVYNHNLESVPALYRRVRPGAGYQRSLDLLARVKQRHSDILTKSGIMLGLGETREQVLQVLRDMRAHGVDILTIGQYLQPAADKLPVVRYAEPQEFADYKYEAMLMGFSTIAAGPYVRSSYNAHETFIDAVG